MGIPEKSRGSHKDTGGTPTSIMGLSEYINGNSTVVKGLYPSSYVRLAQRQRNMCSEADKLSAKIQYQIYPNMDI